MSITVWKEVAIAKEENRHELILSGPTVSERIEKAGLDSAVFSLTNLNYLNIHDTCLEDVPENICDLINLLTLVLHSNKIKTLTSAIGKLQKLKNIDVSRNRLEDFPKEVDQLKNLYSMNASFNQLKKVPCMIHNVRLTILDLSNNSFEDFPDICYAELCHLSEVKLKANLIQRIPCEIRALSSLKILDISENKIKEVPGELCDISKLKEVNLKDNPLADKRLAKLVIQSHSKPKQVLDYIRQHAKRNSVSSEATVEGNKRTSKKSLTKETETLDTNTLVDQLCHKIQVLHVTDNTPVVVVEKEVKNVRPYIVCCIVKNLSFTPDTFKKFIKLQTSLHETICNKRQAATLATHDMDAIPSGALKYVARRPDEVKLQPLGSTKDTTASLIFSRLQSHAHSVMMDRKRNKYSGIHKYLYLLEGKSHYPFLLDSSGRVVSFPPLTNSNITKMSSESTSMFVEVTSSVSQGICQKVLDTFLMECLNIDISKQVNPTASETERSENTLIVEQVRVTDESGSLQVVYPSRTDLDFQDNTTISVVRNYDK